MPTYDYQCGACQHEFEAFQSMSAPVMRKCPECGELKLKRLIGAGAAVVFKGSGFYQTDYRSESYKKRAAEDSSSSSSKSDAKSDAKSESSPTRSPSQVGKACGSKSREEFRNEHRERSSPGRLAAVDSTSRETCPMALITCPTCRQTI